MCNGCTSIALRATACDVGARVDQHPRRVGTAEERGEVQRGEAVFGERMSRHDADRGAPSARSRVGVAERGEVEHVDVPRRGDDGSRNRALPR